MRRRSTPCSTAAGSRRARPCSCSAPPAACASPPASAAPARGGVGGADGARGVAAVSSEAKAEAARAAGADEILVYPRGPFDKEGGKALGPEFKQGGGRGGADA